MIDIGQGRTQEFLKGRDPNFFDCKKYTISDLHLKNFKFCLSIGGPDPNPPIEYAPDIEKTNSIIIVISNVSVKRPNYSI